MGGRGAGKHGARVRFALWAVAGAGGCVSVLGALSIGVFVAPVVVVLVVVLLRTTPVDRSTAGLLSGLAGPLFYVGWLNQQGPGTVCETAGDVTTCSERWAPWPWVAVGIVLLAAGVALFVRLGPVSADRAGR